MRRTCAEEMLRCGDTNHMATEEKLIREEVEEEEVGSLVEVGGIISGW